MQTTPGSFATERRNCSSLDLARTWLKTWVYLGLHDEVEVYNIQDIEMYTTVDRKQLAVCERHV